jgi:carboxypeptidase Taq
MSRAYDAFIARYRDIQAIESALGLMGWDRQVLMPPGGAEARSAQSTILSRMGHELTTSDETRRLLEDAEREVESGSDQAFTLKAFRRDLDIEAKLPTELVERRAKVGGDAYEVWKKARAESNFAAMKPYYDELFEIAREMSHLLDPNAAHPYDPLFDLYEQGAKVQDADAMFGAIKQPIVDLVKEIVEEGEFVPDTFLYGNWDQQALRSVAQEITAKIGFDYNRGRLDIAPSAFCGGTSRFDIRMTTKPSEHVRGILSSSLHEMGHGLYEQGSPAAWDRTPLAGGVSLAVHESQSRMWENIIGRSRVFWTYFLPVLQKALPSFANLDVDTFCRAMNKVEPSFIRVGSDELTYNLHILIRYELEVEILTRRLDAKDLPEAWNTKYTEYLGITPPNDGVGVLQDVHWTRGSLGYFPTYSMGNLIGAQVWATLEREIPGKCELIREGNFAPVLDWLTEKIYSQGRRYEPRDLVLKVTGEPINPAHWLKYATEKFRGIYGLAEFAEA